MFNYKEWYAKTKTQRHLWQRQYYQKHREHILQMHKDWAKRNVDQAGSIWRKYGRWSRIRNPNIDKEYYVQHREQILEKKRQKYRRENNMLMDRDHDWLQTATDEELEEMWAEEQKIEDEEEERSMAEAEEQEIERQIEEEQVRKAEDEEEDRMIEQQIEDEQIREAEKEEENESR